MSAKRRANAAASADMFTPDPKRRKRNDDTHFPDHETTQTTTDLGLKLMRLLKKSQDKNGRNVAGHFLDLISKDEYPEYYVVTKMPISLNMIEDRLEDGEYDSMERLESDLKRLVQNAKDFNSPKSEIFEDAERIRKALSNFMPKHNPAYLDPNYRAYPTPIPQELRERDVSMNDGTPDTNGPSGVKLVLTNNRSARRKSQGISSAGDGLDADMASAQLELLDELLEQPDAANFYERPPKKIPGYYATIKNPTSILDVRKVVEKGKIKDWNEFAAEVRLIWDNAKQFNEDSSDIFQITLSLEEWFEKRVQASGASPRADARLNLKLNFRPQQTEPPNIKLKFTSRSTPNPPAGLVDNDALRRQKEETGQALTRANRATSRAANVNGSTPFPAGIKRNESIAGSSDHHSSAMMVDDNKPVSRSAVPDLAKSTLSSQLHISKSMPTPVADGHPPAALSTLTNGGPHSEIPYTSVSNRNLFAESDNPIERKYRDPGKGLEDAILGSVTFMTHPKLPNDPRWKLNRYASGTKTQTSSYIYLPSDHYYLRVVPNLTEECRSRKRYKICVTRNWEQLYPSQEATGVYDFRVHPGENIIAVDVIADLAEGDSKPYAPPQLQVDFERITFIVMLRDPTPE